MRRSKEVNQSDEARIQSCKDCKAYQLHQYLKGHGQILEEGSDLESQLAEAQAEIIRLENEVIPEICARAMGYEETKTLLEEAQADNAAVAEAYESCEGVKKYMTLPPSYWNEDWSEKREGDYYEADKRYKKAKEALSTPHPGASLLAELEQLQKVRDAAVALPTMDCFITGCFDYHCDCGFKALGQALSQPKEAE
jgi:hypothetical protein